MTFIVSAAVCLIVIYLNVLSHEMSQKIYIEQTEKTIMSLKKDFLKDTVNNIFLEIDHLRDVKADNYQKNTDSRLRRFEDELKLTDEAFITFFKKTFKKDANPKMWTAFLWNHETGEILYASPDLAFETIEEAITDLKANLSSYAKIGKNNITGIFGVSKAYIDNLVKEEMAQIIRSRKFSNDSYIWINEILNYEGGEDYAIRRVHPNLPGTEGEYLSTDMEDIAGNLPYLQELEGINKHGELFFTYAFKELNSFNISEKLTYAKLYKDYNWVIAMGLHVDDIGAYMGTIKDEVDSLSAASSLRLLRYIILVLMIGFIILYFIDRHHFSKSTRHLERKINIDALTKAYSRSYGQEKLNTFFQEYKSVGENPAIMVFDLDGFKYINDYYGHEMGDFVLTEIVKAIKNVIRRSDYLIRWGGDEFVCVLPGLREEQMIAYGQKILEEVSGIEIPVGDYMLVVTVSIGCSYFRDGDTDYSQALKRADDAMYASKKAGKNKVTLQ